MELKKWSAILLFVIYLFTTTEAHQLFKLPVIFEHFKEHRMEDKNISFLEFLDVHYMHGSPKDQDYDRDMQLPFKSSADCLASVVPVVMPDFGNTFEPPQDFFIQNDFVNKNDLFISAEFFCSVFQPPRI